MIRSMETLSRNFDILQKKQENISANVAYINTAGYKAQEIIQSTLQSKVMANHLGGPLLDQKQEVGSFTFGNQIDEMYTSFEQGGLKETASITDLALQGNSFFTIAGDDGQTYYTRNGNFTANADGELVTQEGYRVLGVDANGQPAFIPAGGNDFSVDSSGNINGTGLQLMLTDFENPATLTSIGAALYTGQGGTESTGATVVFQNMIETSNVKTADEITNLMLVAREFEANEKALNTADETLRKAANEIGKV